MEERVRLVRTADGADAELLAARLRAEGVAARVRSEAAGPYRFTVGQMAEAEVWVPATQLDEAREVALAYEIDDSVGRSQAWEPEGAGWSRRDRLLAAAVLALLVGLFVLRALYVIATRVG